MENTKEEKQLLENYKMAIAKIINSSKDIGYLMAVYAFVTQYPDKSRGGAGD